MSAAFFLPLAHAGHWIWLLYVPPVAIVAFSIIRSTILERRKEREERDERDRSRKPPRPGKGPGQSSS
jgi:hypothetical protein